MSEVMMVFLVIFSAICIAMAYSPAVLIIAPMFMAIVVALKNAAADRKK